MTIISIIQAAVWLYVLYLCVVELNKMTKATAPVARWSHIALACGAAAGIVSAISDKEVFELLIAAGIALYMTYNRRSTR
jgi:hypothetical protein